MKCIMIGLVLMMVTACSSKSNCGFFVKLSDKENCLKVESGQPSGDSF